MNKFNLGIMMLLNVRVKIGIGKMMNYIWGIVSVESFKIIGSLVLVYWLRVCVIMGGFWNCWGCFKCFGLIVVGCLILSFLSFLRICLWVEEKFCLSLCWFYGCEVVVL